MTHKDKMYKYLAKVEEVTEQLKSLTPVIWREVDRRYGRKIQAAKTEQERNNLRQFHYNEVGKENIWKQMYLDDRFLYISLATMHGIAALVEQTSASSDTEAF